MLHAYSALTVMFYTASSWSQNFSCEHPVHVVTTVAWRQLHMANENKRRIPHCHHPTQIPRVLEVKASRQHPHVRPWQWHCCHPAFLSLAQHSLQRYLFRQYKVGQSCSRQEMCRRSSGKENKLHEHNPILELKTIVFLAASCSRSSSNKAKVSLSICRA